MIRVSKAPEPADFDAKVRQKGLKYLASKGITLHAPLPPRTHIHPFWRDCFDDLYEGYNGICAYLSIRFERVTGTSTDHYIPKSASPALAYEWSNYRLACLAMNAKKGTSQSVLDPFKVTNGWFRLELLTGGIYPDLELNPDLKAPVIDTIELLGLDKPASRKIRARHFQQYIENHISQAFLQCYSPFVYMEANRQGLL